MPKQLKPPCEVVVGKLAYYVVDSTRDLICQINREQPIHQNSGIFIEPTPEVDKILHDRAIMVAAVLSEQLFPNGPWTVS